MSSTNLKQIALVGCGRISDRHFDALRKCKDRFSLVAVCDSLEARATKAAQMWEASGFTKPEVYTNYLDLLKKYQNRIDLIVLTTPSGMHVEQACQALKSGYSVLSEKPMSTMNSDTDRMHALVKELKGTGKNLFVVKQNRFNAPVREVKRAIDEGRFGKLHTLSARVLWSRPDSYYEEAPWRGTRLMDGGAVMNQASHYVDLFTYFGGAVESVMAYGTTQARKIECEDSAVIAFKFPSGALGSLTVSVLTYPKNLEGSFTILGTEGTAVIGGLALNHLEKFEFSSLAQTPSLEKTSYQTESVYGFGHEPYYKGVHQILNGGLVPEIAMNESCFPTADTLGAIYDSYLNGRATPVKART